MDMESRSVFIMSAVASSESLIAIASERLCIQAVILLSDIE
jgi:hypothetical protein